MMLLRLFLRLVPSASQRICSEISVFWLALSGLAAVLFHLSIIGAETRIIDRPMHAHGRTWIWWTILTPTLGGLISSALLRYVVPGACGSGIPQVKVAYAIRGGRVPLIDAIGKFVIGVLQIGTGSSLGRENHFAFSQGHPYSIQHSVRAGCFLMSPGHPSRAKQTG